jgi:hypothetical protein
MEKDEAARQRDLARLKALEEKKAKLDALLQKQRSTIQEKARLRKNKLFFKIGLLADMAGLSGEDRGFLLGAFLHIAEIKEDKRTYASLKRRGASLLKRREAPQGKK